MRTVAVAFEVPAAQRPRLRPLDPLSEVAVLGDPGWEDSLREAEVLILRGWRRELPPGTIRGLAGLRMVQGLLAGVDHLPWDEIPPEVLVCSNAGSQAAAVAEQALALLLAAAKRVAEHDAAVRAGRFPQNLLGRRLEGMTVGILGYGRIGREVARRARALGMTVVATNRRMAGDKAASDNNWRY